jgi:hypothetical protein
MELQSKEPMERARHGYSREPGPADYPSSVTPDGKTLLFLRITAETAGDILSIPTAGGDITTVLATPAYEGAPQVSKDGKWFDVRIQSLQHDGGGTCARSMVATGDCRSRAAGASILYGAATEVRSTIDLARS